MSECAGPDASPDLALYKNMKHTNINYKVKL